MRNASHWCALAAAVSSVCHSIDVHADWPTFELFGKPAGWTRATPRGMSPDGNVIVGGGSSPLGDEAFIWRRESGFQVVGDLPGGPVEGVLVAVSADGRVAVGYGESVDGTGNYVEAMSWTNETGLVPLGRIGGTGSTWAESVSDDGQVISIDATFTDISVETRHVAQWTQGTGLTWPLNVNGSPLKGRVGKVAPDGSFILARDSSQTNTNEGRASQWFSGESHVIALPLPEGFDPDDYSAGWISRDGRRILGSGNPRDLTFDKLVPLVWVDGVVFRMPVLEIADRTGAGNMSADGRVITGAMSIAGGTSIAMVWIDGVPMRLQEYFDQAGVPWGPGTSTLFQHVSVSQDGQHFLGSGISAGNAVHWLAYVPLEPLPPCPSDVNGDTGSDVLDFLDFMDAFGQCETLPGPCVLPGTVVDADFNGDTVVDVGDFLDFFDAFGTGCTG